MLNYITTNWKTTLVGVIAIATTVIETWLPQYRGLLTQATAILIGLGLVAAKDGNVSNAISPVIARTVSTN